MPKYLIDTGKEPRVIHNLDRIRTKSQRELCQIMEIRKRGEDRYFPKELDNAATVERYVAESPIHGHNYVRCLFCNREEKEGEGGP